MISLPSSRTASNSTILLAAVALLVLAARPAHGQSAPDAGFSFLRLEPSARAAALGGSFSAVYGDDVNALFYNPALLNEGMHRALGISYLNHLGEVNAGFVAHARHLEGIGTVGAGLRFVSWGSTEGYDEQGTPTGDFHASDAALTVSFSRQDDERLHYGASLHTVFSRIGSYNATAFAGDAGVAYHLADQQLTLTASANNVGIVVNSLGSTDDLLPWDLRVGIAKRLRYVPLLLSITGYNLNRIGEESAGQNAVSDAMRHIAFGGEFQFSDAFNVRVGYNHQKHQDLKLKSRLDLAGFGAGFGIKISSFRFDYAFNSWSSMGGLHQFTVRTVI